MKKSLLLLQIFVVILFVAKITALGEVLQKPDKAKVASALTTPLQKGVFTGNISPTVKDEGEDNLAKPRDLFISLEAKKSELEKKEQLLKSEEQRLLSLRKEILEKIDVLRVQEEKMSTIVEASKSGENKKYKDLAKVFEATPPAKAGVMLEQLDVQTAAGITMNMKRDKAGAIWGYLTPRKAVEITREITRTAKQKPN